MRPSRHQGGFQVRTAGGTIPPRRLGLLARLVRAWAALMNEPKPPPFSKPRIEGDTIIFDPCEAYPFGKITPLPGGQDPTPRTGNGQANKLAEAMRRALRGR